MWQFAFVVAVLASILLLRLYAEKGTPYAIMIPVLISWSLGFFFFLVLPFDLEHALCRKCRQSLPPEECACLAGEGGMGIDQLKDLIPAAYTVTMLLGYLMNDLLREYVASGEFTRRGKWLAALREAAMFYVPALLIGMGFVVYMMIQTEITSEKNGFMTGLSNTKVLGRAMVNTLGLIILVGFLGYGLVEVPRSLWNKGDVAGQLRFLQFKVAVQSEELQSARRKLEETLELVHSTDAQLREEARAASTQSFTRMEKHMTTMLTLCSKTTLSWVRQPSDPNLEQAAAAAAARQAELAPISHKGLVKLHTRLKKAITNEKVARGMYENYILRGMRHQQATEAGAQAVREGSDSSRGMPAASEQGGTAAAEQAEDHLLACPLLAKHAPLAFRATSVLCLGISVLIIFCEGTIILTGWPLNLHPSPLFHLFRYLGGGGGGVLVLALLYVPMIYCAFCTYFAMFRMKLCDFYALHPHHSDAGSLLFNATYACRFGPALCFNMLKLLEASVILEADDQTCSTFEAESATPPDEAQIQPICTYFSQTMFANMDKLPDFISSGDNKSSFTFNNYAPLLIVILCGCTYLNLFSNLASCCMRCVPCINAQSNSFSFDEDFSDTRIDHGAQILTRERQAMAEGSPLGANLQLLSGATSDGEEASKASARQAPSSASRNLNRWNHLQDDHL